MSVDVLSVVMVMLAALALLMGLAMSGRYTTVRLALWTVSAVLSFIVAVMYLTSSMLVQALIFGIVGVAILWTNWAEYKTLTTTKTNV